MASPDEAQAAIQKFDSQVRFLLPISARFLFGYLPPMNSVLFVTGILPIAC